MDLRILLFLALVFVAAGLVPWVAARLRKQGRHQVSRARERLAANGWVIEETTSQQGRKQLRVWGQLSHPVSLDLRVRRRSRLWGGLSAGSTGMLDPAFERAFTVASGEPDRARLILEPGLQQQLLRWPRAELRLGSYESLLPRDYCSGDDPARLGQVRRLRALWMIRLPGTLAKLSGPEEIEALGVLGRGLAEAVAKHCLPPAGPDARGFETGSSEAWL